MTSNTNSKETSDKTPVVGRPKPRTLLAGAVLSVGLAGVAALALMGPDASAGSAPTGNYAAVEIPVELRASMQANGLSGLSPASAVPIDSAYTTQDLAAWAKQNNMTGLSAASLSPIGASRE